MEQQDATDESGTGDALVRDEQREPQPRQVPREQAVHVHRRVSWGRSRSPDATRGQVTGGHQKSAEGGSSCTAWNELALINRYVAAAAGGIHIERLKETVHLPNM